MQKPLNLQAITNKLKERRVNLMARWERKRESIQTDDVYNPDADDRAMASLKYNQDKLLLNRMNNKFAISIKL